MDDKKKLFERKFWIHILFFVVAIGLIVYFVPRDSRHSFSYEVGKPWAGAPLYAKAQMAVRLDPATEKAKKDSIDRAFVPFFKHDAAVGEKALKQLDESVIGSFFARQMLQTIYDAGIVENDVYDSILAHKLPNIKVIEVVESGRKAKTVSTAGMYSAKMAYKAIEDKIGGALAVSVVDFAELIKPNYIADKAENKRYVENAYRSACTRAPIEKGELIIGKGEKVTPQKAMEIQAYEKWEADSMDSGEGRYSVLGFAVLVVVLFFLLFVYISYYRRAAILEDKRKLLFVLMLVSALTIFAYTLMPRFVYGEYFIPVTLIPVVLVTFFDSRTAFFLSVVQVLLCSLVADSTLEFVMLHLTASIVAIDTLQELSKRSQLIRTAIFVFFTYSVVYVALYIVENGSVAGLDLKVFFYFSINAILLSFAYVIIFVFEKLFGFVSKVTLVELSDINTPLLQELSEKCPGTFQHSVQLSNLAAEAAREIGANSQLARAGALYHDIGKMDNPAFFTENQHDVNPHELISPEQSAKIVIRHVTDGVKRADKEKLPADIKNFILEHHGKNLAKYFYTTACNNNGGEPVDPAPYTYPGPNPRSKETAILMMADATEAASRSLKEYNDETISGLVNKIIDGQIAQGLMKDSPLSFRDVEVVKKVFISRLRTMYHTRISYPEMKKKPD